MTLKDSIFAELKESITPFKFDEQVAEVFDDMIKRSVPGYEVLVTQLANLAEKVVVPGSNIYDLGSSLGAVSIAIRRQLNQSETSENCHLYAIDNSAAMVEKSKILLAAYHSDLPVTIEENDIQNVKIFNSKRRINKDFFSNKYKFWFKFSRIKEYWGNRCIDKKTAIW